MLIGRGAERAEIERLVARAAEGRGGALVLRREAGVGKTALLEHAAAAQGFRVLRALGVETEAQLPFARLHKLLRPVADAVEAVPRAQTRALRVALGLRSRGELIKLFAEAKLPR